MEYVSAPVNDAGDVRATQRNLYVARLLRGSHQYCDVSCPYFSSIQESVFLQQRGNAAAELSGDPVVPVRLRDPCFSVPGFMFTLESDDVEPRGVFRVDRQCVFSFGGDILLGDLSDVERVFPRSKKRIESSYEFRVGTPVGFHRIDVVPGIRYSVQIRKDIGSPEAVDGLFWIADQKYR